MDRLVVNALLCGVLVGCGGSDLAQEWQLDRLRILGVRATPAEPAPGDVVTFESFVYVPGDVTLESVVWLACLPEGGVAFGCELDPAVLDTFSSLDPATARPEELAAAFEAAQEAGLIGFQPGLDPVWVAPADALDGLSDAERLEGVNALVNLTALPVGAGDDFDATEVAFKRVPISEATTPNHNPDVDGISVAGGGYVGGAGTPDDPVVARAGGELVLTPVLGEDAVEDYVFVDSTGQTVTRTEEPYFAWYTEGGDFDQNVSLPPSLEARLTVPEQPGWTGLVATVMRDRRGGMGWSTITVAVE